MYDETYDPAALAVIAAALGIVMAVFGLGMAASAVFHFVVSL